MSAAPDFELPPHAAVPAEAVDAADVRAARAARAEPGRTIPLADVLAKYGDDLAAYPPEQ